MTSTETGDALITAALSWMFEDLEGDIHEGDRETWISRLIRDDRTSGEEANAIANALLASPAKYGLRSAAAQRLITEALEVVAYKSNGPSCADDPEFYFEAGD